MERYYWGALATTNLGKRKLCKLVECFGTAQKTWLADAEALLKTGIYQEKVINKFLEQRDRALPEILQKFCEENFVRLLTIVDDDYPYRLKQIVSPPPVLYIKGNLPDCSTSIGIVGSRKASAYGVKVAENFAADLASENVVIISGGAKGIDTAAHKGALSVQGQTVAVLGCGIDINYPAENAALFTEIGKLGAVITEFAPGTKPLARNFPLRNRIVNGLSHGILVVEAAKKSGAMITAEFALDEGHEVYCIPGSIYLPNSIGCHSLIKSGAQLVDRPEDILNDLQIQYSVGRKAEHLQLFAAEVENNFSELERNLLDIISKGLTSLEEIVEISGYSLAEISCELLELEVRGIIGQTEGRQYYRI